MDRLSNVLEPARAAKREYNTMQREAPDNIPYPTISGPTADSVNAASAQQQPSTISEFYGRGGLSNTAKQMQNAVAQKQQKRELKAQYERFLEAGEKGADALYQDAISLFGSGISEWIPPKDFSYDEEGIFLPHKYAQAVYLGIQKFVESEKNKQKNIQAGTIIAGAPDRQTAAVGVLQSGQSLDPYKEAVRAVPTLQDQAQTIGTLATADKTDADTKKTMVDVEYLPMKYQAEANKANAEASKIRQENSPGGGKRSALLVGLDGRKNDILKQLGDNYRFLADRGTIKDEKELVRVNKFIDSLTNEYEKINERIAAEEKTSYPGVEVHPPKPAEASKKAISAAMSIIDGMQQSPPKKYETITGPTGAQSLQEKGWFADKTPNSELYNKELSSRVIQYAYENGWPKERPLDPVMIIEELKTGSLEDAIDGILDRIIKYKQQVPTNPAETIQ